MLHEISKTEMCNIIKLFMFYMLCYVICICCYVQHNKLTVSDWGDKKSNLYVFFFLSYFVEGCVTYRKLYIFNVYNWMSLEISIHLWNHHHSLCHKTSQYFQKYPPTFFIYYYFFSVIRTFHIRSTHLAKF